MYSLVINSSNGFHCALFKNNLLITEFKYTRDEIKLAEEILLKITDLLLSASINIRQIAFIAIVNGPGFFTGLRVGIVVVKILQATLKIPAIPINALYAMVFQANKDLSGFKILESKGNGHLFNVNKLAKEENFYFISGCDIGKKGLVLEVYKRDISLIIEASYFDEDGLKNLFNGLDFNAKYFILGSKIELFLSFTKQYNLFYNEDISFPNSSIINEIAFLEYQKNQDTRIINPIYAKDADVSIK